MSTGEIFLSSHDAKSKTLKCTLNYLVVTQRLTVGIKPVDDNVWREQMVCSTQPKEASKIYMHILYSTAYTHSICSMYIHNPNVSKIWTSAEMVLWSDRQRSTHTWHHLHPSQISHQTHTHTSMIVINFKTRHLKPQVTNDFTPPASAHIHACTHACAHTHTYTFNVNSLPQGLTWTKKLGRWSVLCMWTHHNHCVPRVAKHLVVRETERESVRETERCIKNSKWNISHTEGETMRL